MSFKNKVFLSYVVLFLLFLSLLYVFTGKVVEKIVARALEERADELIKRIDGASDKDNIVVLLKQQKPMMFFRVSLIDGQNHVLYDTHVKRLLKEEFSQNYVVSHPEVTEAQLKGTAQSTGFSNLLGQSFTYIAKSFNAHGQKYVIRIAFPTKYVDGLSAGFQAEFTILLCMIFIFFTLLAWGIMLHFSRPIHQIIDAVKPYQEGSSSTVPQIIFKDINPRDDFGLLANTLNSLSEKVRSQITVLTTEKDEKAALLESLIEGVIAIDHEMCVTYANSTALRLFRQSAEAVLGKSFRTFYQPKCEQLLEACQQQHKVLSEALELHQEGKKIHLTIIAAPIKTNGGAVLIMQDESVRYKLLEMRKDFVANASHELKTPITIIRGFAETLHDNPDLPKEVMIDVTGRIVRNCEKMANIIKDLLTLSDIENLPLSRLAECDLLEIIDRCRTNILTIYPETLFRIDNLSGSSIHLTADPILLELAIMNLVENAVKYSESPAEITITTQTTEEMIKLAISDKGIGIPANDIENIFQRFYTVNKALSRSMGGSGLGLSIVQTIIDKHFGKIEVQSEVGKGTTFTIFLPKEIEKMLTE